MPDRHQLWDSRAFLFREQREGRARALEVELGMTRARYVPSRGLATGDALVVAGLQGVCDLGIEDRFLEMAPHAPGLQQLRDQTPRLRGGPHDARILDAPMRVVEATPIDRHGLAAALELFVTNFVVADKRTQIRTRLLAAERRLETLETLPRWIAVRTAPLAGADQSPAGLRTRFGELVGVRLGETGATRTTIAGALELGRAVASVFVADSGAIALITLVTGAPILCSRF